VWEQVIDDHVRVRPLTRADAQLVFDVVDANRAYLRQWLPWLDYLRRAEDELPFLERVEARAPGTALVSGVFVDSAFAGVVGFNMIDDAAAHATIGYWLGERFGGRGIMSRCVAALIDHGFDRLNLRTIDIRAATGNARSRAISERLGFAFRRIIPQAEWLYDHHVDHAEYVLTADEWRARRAERT
jgi:ribosomal-protein-serine acetyltransferase